MKYISEGLFALAYLLAVADGAFQDKGLYPSSPGRMGLRRYAEQHPLIVVGAVLGVAGAVVGGHLRAEHKAERARCRAYEGSAGLASVVTRHQRQRERLSLARGPGLPIRAGCM
jgi:hypothetical protein